MRQQCILASYLLISFACTSAYAAATAPDPLTTDLNSVAAAIFLGTSTQAGAGATADSQRANERVALGVKLAQAQLSSNEVRLLQELLARLGYRPGPADGQSGARTRAAVRAYLDEMGFPRETPGEAVLSLVRATRPLSDLKVGDCIISPGTTEIRVGAPRAAEVVVPCLASHSEEVSAVLQYPTHGTKAYPSKDGILRNGWAQCIASFEDYVAAHYLEAGYELNLAWPTEEAWRDGDRTVLCKIGRADRQLKVGSASKGGAILPDGHRHLNRIQEGECFDGGFWIQFPQPVSCSGPHDFEAYAVYTVAPPGGNEPDSVKLLEFANYWCREEFGKRIGGGRAGGLIFLPIALPQVPTEVTDVRTLVCAARAHDRTEKTGSEIEARIQFEQLAQAEFEGFAQVIEFEDFGSDAGIEHVGSSRVHGSALLLTSLAKVGQKGAAWLSNKVRVDQGFETAFVFQQQAYDKGMNAGEGFAFVIQNDGPTALGEVGGAMGLGYSGIANSLAIEFDTQRPDWAVDEPVTRPRDASGHLANQLSVQTRGVGANSEKHTASIGWTALGDDTVIADGTAHLVFIRYESGQLTIFVDDMEEPALNVEVDLTKTLRLDDGAAFVGFTAAAQGTHTFATHRIASWKFAHNGEAAAAPAPEELKPEPASEVPGPAEAMAVWETVKDSTSAAVLNAFAEQYEGTVFAALALARVGELGETEAAPESEPIARMPQPKLALQTWEWTIERDAPGEHQSNFETKFFGAGRNGVDLTMRHSVVGTFIPEQTNFRNMFFVINHPLSGRSILTRCPGVRTAVWSGSHHLIVDFDRVGDAFIARHLECIVPNVSADIARFVELFTTGFQDMAINMMVSGEVDTIEHEGFRRWVPRVATGEIEIQPGFDFPVAIEDARDTQSTEDIASMRLSEGKDAYVQSDYRTAIRLLRPLAEGGEVQAQVLLGLMYLRGQGVTQDLDEALRWYRLAAEQGNQGAQASVTNIERRLAREN